MAILPRASDSQERKCHPLQPLSLKFIDSKHTQYITRTFKPWQIYGPFYYPNNPFLSEISTLLSTLTPHNSYSRWKLTLPYCLRIIVCHSFIRLRSPNHSDGSGRPGTALAIITVNEWTAPELWQGNVTLRMPEDESCRWSRIMDLAMSARLQQHDKWNGSEGGNKPTNSPWGFILMSIIFHLIKICHIQPLFQLYWLYRKNQGFFFCLPCCITGMKYCSMYCTCAFPTINVYGLVLILMS